MLVGVINPGAGHRPAVELAHALATGSPRLRLIISDRPDDVDGVLDAIRDGAELLVIAGGDGTTCNLITRIERAGLLDRLPALLVLPAGRVNTVAGALVGSRRPAQLAGEILQAWTRGKRRIARVPVVRVRIAGGLGHTGFTASIGAIARIHADYRRARIQGAIGIAETLARFGMFALPSERFAPIDGPFELAPDAMRLSAITLAMASPLPRFFRFVRPFPGVDTVATGDSVHLVAANLGPLALQAVLPGLLRGLLAPHPLVHYGRAARLAWRNGPRSDLVVLDGEELEVPAGAEVKVEVAGQVPMVVWSAAG